MRANLKQARKQLGLTQQKLADELNITLRYYKMLEAGTTGNGYTIWDKLEDITGIPQRELREISENHHDQVANQ